MDCKRLAEGDGVYRPADMTATDLVDWLASARPGPRSRRGRSAVLRADGRSTDPNGERGRGGSRAEALAELRLVDDLHAQRLGLRRASSRGSRPPPRTRSSSTRSRPRAHRPAARARVASSRDSRLECRRSARSSVPRASSARPPRPSRSSAIRTPAARSFSIRARFSSSSNHSRDRGGDLRTDLGHLVDLVLAGRRRARRSSRTRAPAPARRASPRGGCSGRPAAARSGGPSTPRSATARW